jgi:hypothetical protein
MLDLSTVTAVSVDGDGSRFEMLTKVISAMRQHLRFADIKVLSGEREYASHCTWIKRRCTSIREYNRICLFELDSHVETEFCMIFQHDGFPMFPKNWTRDFLSVDYIGAPWEPSKGHDWAHEYSVGNGGFSIRSKKLIELVKLAAKKAGRKSTLNNEDGFICLTLRDYLTQNGCTFADYPLARRFSIETLLDGEGVDLIQGSFGFHDTSNVVTSLLKDTYGSLADVPESIFDSL